MSDEHKYFDSVITVPPFDMRLVDQHTLTSAYPRAAFRSNSNRLFPAGIRVEGVRYRALERLHWGQRKLLLSEIAFLSQLKLTQRTIVIYAGGADGRHMPLLTRMFPHIELHLYDPRPFYPGIESDRIQLNPYYVNRRKDATYGFFTDDVARHYAGQRVVFISDIRRIAEEPEIMQDQESQRRWIEIMRPVSSMLKFKMPYPDRDKSFKYTYLSGDIYFQCWAPVTSAESRLVVGNMETTVYDIAQYEQQMSYFNNFARLRDFGQQTLSELRIADSKTKLSHFWARWSRQRTYGYDYVYELQILARFLGEAAIENNLAELIEQINTVLISPGSRFDNYLKKIEK